MREEIETMIEKIVQGKHIEAQESYSRIMSQKALDRVNSLKAEVGADYFNKTETE